MSARIPFALLGVVLLVGSSTLAGTLQQPVVSEPDVDEAIAEIEAESQSALREAAMTAGHNAARNPVTRPAETGYGPVLNESTPFRDALRIRIYLRVRDNLARLSGRRHGVNVRVSLPSVDDPEALRAAKHRIHVTRAGEDGTALRVRVENVTITARRGDNRVAVKQFSPTFVVRTPTLAVHDRVQLFERRLAAGPLQPGLGRRLTARLYPIVWTRGYVQYGGGPIENVLANRHVALFTNSALLSMQRDTFGHSDPGGRYVLRRALASTVLMDALGSKTLRTRYFLRRAHQEVGLVTKPVDAIEAGRNVEPPRLPEENVTVGVNGTADGAFLATYARLNRTLRRTYSARVVLKQRVQDLGTRRTRTPASPGENWTLVDTEHETDTAVRVREADAGKVALAPEYHRLKAYSRTVVRAHTTIRVWSTPQGTERTVGRTVDRATVTFVIGGNHSRGTAPIREIEGVHSPGGPFGGPNLADVPDKAHRTLVGARGGIDELAIRATGGDDVSTTAVVFGDRPDRLDEWVYTDLTDLRERVRNVSMTTTRGEIATFQSNPPAILAAKLRERRQPLVGAPDRYPSVARRARIAARTAYLDMVIDSLEMRARRRQVSKSKLRDALADASRDSLVETAVKQAKGKEGRNLSERKQVDPLKRLQEGYERRQKRDPPGRLDGLRMRVDTEPSYLTRTAVSGKTVPAIPTGTAEHPLVTRNWNVITLPYGDIADAIVSAILGPKRTRLSSGAQVLHAIERTNDSFVGIRPTGLRRHVATGTVVGARTARSTLSSFGLGNESSRRRVVQAALTRWNTTGSRALAVTNGSAARAIHEVAVRRWSDELTPRSRDLLALRLEGNMHEAVTSEQARPPQPVVNGTANKFRNAMKREIKRQFGEVIKRGTKRAIGRVANKSLSRLPAGLPVAPVPGFWYATVNLWRVRVAGEYARFVVRVPRGTPNTPGAQLQYVRDAGAVQFDVDDDGRDELLGHTTRISFRTGTDVGIAVPPGPQGVGDVNGQMFEDSPGWPRPGP